MRYGGIWWRAGERLVGSLVCSMQGDLDRGVRGWQI